MERNNGCVGTSGLIEGAHRKRPEFVPDARPVNQGDDISGIVHEVGEHVSEFKPGDRVFAFHEMMQPGGSYAEYAVSWSATTAHLPAHVSFQGTRHTSAMAS